MEVLIRLPQLDTLDKEDFTHDDKLDALAAYEERKEEFDQEDAEEEVSAVLNQLDPKATPKYFSRSLVGNLARFSRSASFFEIVCTGLPNGPCDGSSEPHC